jgi:hypothetical protein
MTIQSEQRLISQGQRAPTLEIVNGRCGTCGGNVSRELAPDEHRRWWRRSVCLSCGLDHEQSLDAPRPLPTGDDMQAQRRGRPRKGTALGPEAGGAA